MRIIAAIGAVAVVIAIAVFALRKEPEPIVETPAQPVVSPEEQKQNDEAKAKEAAELASRQKELDKLWKGMREFGNITRIRTGNCWAGQYTFNNPKNVTLSNEEWETLIKILCYLQGQEYQCEQLTTMENPLPKESFVSLLSEERTTKLLGDEITKAIRYDTEHEIEFHGNTLSKLPSIGLLEKRFDILEQESGACDNDE